MNYDEQGGKQDRIEKLVAIDLGPDSQKDILSFILKLF